MPHEVLEALQKPELTFPYPFLLEGDMADLGKRIEEERPTLIALSVLAFPVSNMRKFLDDREIQKLLNERYTMRDIGKYMVWELKRQ